MRTVQTKSLVTKIRILAEHVGQLSDELESELPPQTWTYLVKTAAELDEAAELIEQRTRKSGPQRPGEATQVVKRRISH